MSNVEQTLPDLEAEARRLVQAGEERHICLRLMGGLAIRLHCPSAGVPPFQREYADLDFVTDSAGGRKLDPFLKKMGYQADERFNLMNGKTRRLFLDPGRNNRQVDVFVGDFEMCHRLPLAARLSNEPLTLPLAELLLSKLQIVQLNEKDVLDILALLHDHPLGPADAGLINAPYIAALCARDWGLYTTVMDNLERLQDLLQAGKPPLEEQSASLVHSRINQLKTTLQDTAKPLAWKARARLGRSVPWYRQVEEVKL